MEQLQAIAPLISPSTSNATLPQWQRPLYIIIILLSCQGNFEAQFKVKQLCCSMRYVVLLQDEYFIELDDRRYICVVGYVTLKHFRVRRKGSQKVFDGIEEKVAHGNVWGL